MTNREKLAATIAGAAAIAAIMVTISTSSPTPTQADEPQQFSVVSTQIEPGYGGVTVVKDNVVGCQYIVTRASNGDSGITPRLDSFGKPMCGGQ